jgi:RNA polymerase sigma-70 factor (ECF subfamily)
MTERDDQRLLDSLRAGRPEACAELVCAHYQALYRFLVHLTRDVHLAEDLTQETFAAAWEKLATFQGRSTLATWLHRIAYTRFVDAQRAEQRATAARQRLEGSPVSSADPLAGLVADEESRRLYRALDALATPERTLLVLHYSQGLSYRDMAAVLEEPIGTLKWRTAEALNRLRSLLNEEAPDHARRTVSESGPLF